MNFILILVIMINIIFSHNHPELNWNTIETDHFYIHFHDETVRSAREAASIAEKIYEPITAYYEFEPDSKTHIIIQDTDDYANGAAYYYDNKIIIWALPLDFDLRGSHRWLNNVITHEFVHIVQIGASMKYSRKFPASFFQLMGYEAEKRKDVLYGYPNILMSYPLPGVSVPPWLAEGTAQVMYPGAEFDFWDSHRDMIVRDRILNNNLLSFNAMNTFGKKGIGNESTYNQGFLFSSWLCKKYGNDILKKISISLSKKMNYSINSAMRDATGDWGKDLYNEWKSYLDDYYDELIQNLIEYEKKGNVIVSDGTTNIHPVWAPDGKQFAYLSNKDHDGFGQTDLFIYSFIDSTTNKIAGGVKTAPTWIDDSTIVFTRHSKPNKWGSKYFDLYRYTFSNEEEHRMTYGSRMISPVYNKDLNSIVSISTFDGTSNVMISKNVDIFSDSLNFEPLTNLNNGMQLLSATWHEGDLLVDGVYHQGRQIYKVDLINGELELLTSGKWERRDQSSNNSKLIYTSDKSGINNLVLLSDGKEKYITNVYGGAFMPSISKEGKILFSLYEKGGYKIAILNDHSMIDDKYVGYEEDYFSDHPLSELILGDDFESSKYEDKMLSMSFFPKLMIDYNTIKPGFYFMGSEVIDRFSIFGGVSTNNIFDIDIFLLLEYKKLLPTFYTNLFWITRNRDADRNDPYLYPRINGTDVDNIEIYNDLSFNLFSGDLGIKMGVGLHKLNLKYNYSNYREHVEQNVYQSFSYNNIDTVIWQHGEIAFDYFRGHSISIDHSISKMKRAYAMNMLPGNGWNLNSSISYEWNQFMDGFAVSEEYSTFGANFVSHNTARFLVEAQRNFTVNRNRKIVASIEGNAGGISKPDIDDFFHFFNGGLPGVKGYTFYEEALTGPYFVIGTAAMRLPVFLEKNYIFAQFNIQNFSLGGIFQAGTAFNNSFSKIFDPEYYKLSAGLEFRLHGFSFYSYPSAISYEFHKPITDFNEKGKHYFTLLFDY